MNTGVTTQEPRAISPQVLHLHLAAAGSAEQTIQVIDVRTPAEFASEHVEAARNVPLDLLASELQGPGASWAKDAPVYLLCRSGRRAQTAASAFAAAGFSRIFVVEGGTEAWIADGLPVHRGGRRVIALERQVRIGAGLLVLLGVSLGLLVAPAWLFLAGFVGAGLVFAGVTDWCGMGLLLARAPWNR
ncbi:MAG: rhodanese-like domain-containing protein [Chthoniobacterales bacterium]